MLLIPLARAALNVFGSGKKGKNKKRQEETIIMVKRDIL